jgi:outer membrane beta-barrel protein
MERPNGSKLWILASILGLLSIVSAFGAERKTTKKSSSTATETPSADTAFQAEQVDVNAIKEKYWARGEEAELGVVQNRQYSKSGKIQVGVLGGLIFSDPFLSIQSVGGQAGYHFTETLGVSLIGWTKRVGSSDALDTFQRYTTGSTNANRPRWYAGTEFNYSLLYGKLSLIGKSIIYYDMHLLGGFGVTSTDSGRYLTGTLGVGQRFYLSRLMSLRLDYRLMPYRENIIEQNITSQLGQIKGQRVNYSNSISLGIDFLIGSDSK